MFLDVYSKKEYEEKVNRKKKKLKKIFFSMVIIAGSLGLPYGDPLGVEWVYGFFIGGSLGAIFSLIPYAEMFPDEDILPFGIYDFFDGRGESIERAKHIGNYETGAYAIKYFNPSSYYEITTQKGFYLVIYENGKLEIVKEEKLPSV